MEAQNMAPEVLVEGAAVETVVPVAAGDAVVTDVAAEVVMPEAGMSQNWFERASEFLASKGLPGWAIEVTVFGVTSLILGFLFKSFGRYLALLVLLLIAVGVGMHYANFMPEYLMQAKQFIGIESLALQDAPMTFVAWAKVHYIACVSAVVGFFIGWKLG